MVCQQLQTMDENITTAQQNVRSGAAERVECFTDAPGRGRMSHLWNGDDAGSFEEGGVNMNAQKTKWQYICPNCGRTFWTDKGPSDIKTCSKCKHQFVSTVLFEE